MDARPLFIVFCESEVKRVTFVQYVRADTEAAALTFVREPGVVPLSAKLVDPSSDWMLDSINRAQRGIAGANDLLCQLHSAPANRNLFSTTVWAVITGLFLFLLIAWAVGFVTIRR